MRLPQVQGFNANNLLAQFDAGQKQGQQVVARNKLAEIAGMIENGGDIRGAAVRALGSGLPQANALFNLAHGDRSHEFRVNEAERSQGNFDKRFEAGRDDARFSRGMAEKRYAAGRDDAAFNRDRITRRDELDRIDRVDSRRKSDRAADRADADLELRRENARYRRLEAEAKRNAKRAGKPLTQDQSKAVGFHLRTTEADKILARPDIIDAAMSLSEAAKAGVPVFGNKLVTKQFQQYDQARRNFINAVLRRESGAVISDAEFDNANRQYFPQPGDGPEVIAQKAANRRQSIEGLRIAAGHGISAPGGNAGGGGQRLKFNPQTGELE